MKPALLAGIVIVAIALCGSVQAATSAQDEFNAGETAYHQGNYALAVERYEQAYRLSREPALLYNIAQAYRLAGDCEHAIVSYQQFIALDPTSERRALADELVGELEPKCGASIGDVSGGATIENEPAKLLIAISGGTGIGYVSGETEDMNLVKNSSLGSSLVVIQPELGYYVSPQLSIGAAARIGIPVGANVEGHASVAPAGLIRVRYALGAAGEGVRFMGQAGIGVMRNTTKLDNSEPGMDTDIVAQGPLLIGVGVGYVHRLSANLSFIADLSSLVGIAMGGALSGLSSKFNTGFGGDLSIGLQLGI